MRRFGLLICAFVAALAASVLARGQPVRPGAEPATPAGPAAPVRTVTASGSATVRGKSDSARLYFGIYSTGNTVTQAREENARTVRKVREAVAALKIDGLRIRTTASDVSAVREREHPEKVTGYTVSQSFAILITGPDPEKLAATAEHVLDAGLQNGVNADGGVSFFLADDSALRREARQKAVEDAVLAAKALAAGAKGTIADVIKIEEVGDGDGDSGPRGGGLNPFNGSSAPDKPVLAAGAWEVTIRVRVVCRY